jgi:hypothetical protein
LMPLPLLHRARPVELVAVYPAPQTVRTKGRSIEPTLAPKPQEVLAPDST